MGLLKTKDLSLFLSIVLFFMLCFAWFVFSLLFGCFVLGMVDEGILGKDI